MSINFDNIFKNLNLGGLHAKVDSARKRVNQMKITGEAGAGMVKVTLHGDGNMQNVEIDPILFSEKEKDMIEELVVSAFNEAQKKLRAILAHEMKALTGGAPLPGFERLMGLE